MYQLFCPVFKLQYFFDKRLTKEAVLRGRIKSRVSASLAAPILPRHGPKLVYYRPHNNNSMTKMLLPSARALEKKMIFVGVKHRYVEF